MTSTVASDGISAPATDAVDATDLHIALVEPEIHWNTGNAGRTCLALGARLHLIGPLGFSLDEKQIRRAGLDYWPRVRPSEWSDWTSFEAELPNLGEPVFFTAEATTAYWDFAFSGPTVLVFGCESRGLPAEIRSRYASRLVGIPIVDREVRSLNLSTAVAVAGYEVRRQQRTIVDRSTPRLE